MNQIEAFDLRFSMTDRSIAIEREREREREKKKKNVNAPRLQNSVLYNVSRDIKTEQKCELSTQIENVQTNDLPAMQSKRRKRRSIERAVRTHSTRMLSRKECTGKLAAIRERNATLL